MLDQKLLQNFRNVQEAYDSAMGPTLGLDGARLPPHPPVNNSRNMDALIERSSVHKKEPKPEVGAEEAREAEEARKKQDEAAMEEALTDRRNIAHAWAKVMKIGPDTPPASPGKADTGRAERGSVRVARTP